MKEWLVLNVVEKVWLIPHLIVDIVVIVISKTKKIKGE